MRILSFGNEIKSDLPSEIHIVPLGEWKERGFRIEASDCQDIMRNFESFGIKLVIDYEHQSLNANYNGQPAPAAGWIGKLELRDNGIWATDLEWTEDAKALIASKKYRYISPVIVFDDHDPHTDSWIGCSLHSVALTNTPYFRDDLEPIVNSRYTNNKPAKAGVNKEINMTLEEQVAALKAEAQVKDAKIAELKTAVAAKNEALALAEIQKQVEDAIAAKKMLPAQKEVGMIMAKQGKEAFDKFIACNVVADLTKTTDIAEGDAHNGADPQAEYRDLLKNASKMEALKKDNPAKFEALRRDYYGGE